LPDDLLAAIEATGTLPLAFRLRRGGAEAVAEAVARVRDRSLPDQERLSLLRTLGELKRPEAADAVRGIALGINPQAKDSPGVRVAAMAALAGFTDPGLAGVVLDALPSCDETVRVAGFTLLAARPEWSRALLEAIAAGRIAATAVPEDVAGRLRGHREPSIREAAVRLLPVATHDAPQRRIEAIREVLATGSGNPYAGRATFLAKCGQCHRLFHDGGNVGPVLTTYQRDDLATMLRSIVDPSAEIREGYQYFLVITDDGRSLTGFVVDRDPQATVLRTLDGETVTLAADEIDTIEPLGKSLMPAGLLDGLDDRQIRDFFAYLRIKQPIASN
jgi:putative heme-binding domain-containing protein